MDPEFKRALTIVVIVGSIIGAAGYTTLYFIFRAFGTKQAGKSSHVGLMVGLLAFILVTCIALFTLSYAGQ
jgi:hypothetical protein